MPITIQDDKEQSAKEHADAQKREVDRVYTEINQEVADLMDDNDKIVFGPTEDFEYTAPLEDFKKFHQTGAH